VQTVFDSPPPRERHSAGRCPRAAPTRTLRQRAEAARAQGVPPVRPWVRYFARMSDFWLGGFILGLLWGCSGLETDIPQFAVGLLLPFIWLFVEALLLATLGTTPA